MKCLSVSQPFADLIISGRKKVELRRWNTRFRGRFLVHAPSRIRAADCTRLGILGKPVTGVIIGSAEIYGVKRYSSGADVAGDAELHLAQAGTCSKMYGFMLKDARALRVPIPYKGRLGLFEAKLPGIGEAEIRTEIIEEEHRYQWIGRH